MTYFYLLEYWSEEDSNKVSLLHSEKFSEMEFREKVIQASLEILLNRRKNIPFLDFEEGSIEEFDQEFYEKAYEEKKYDDDIDYSKETKQQYVDRVANRRYSRFSYIFDDVANVLCEMFGFEKLVYTQTCGANGWGAIVDKERSFTRDDSLLNEIADRYWEIKKK